MTPSFQSIRNVLLAKGYVALATLLLCVSVLGVQGLGLFHSVVHAHPSHLTQASAVTTIFDSIEKSKGVDAQAAKSACQLLDDLLLAAGLPSPDFEATLLVFAQDTASHLPILQYPSHLHRVYHARAPPYHLV